MINQLRSLLFLRCVCVIFFSPPHAFGEAPIMWNPLEWAIIGFPQNLDRKTSFSEEQVREVQAFFDQMLAAIENRKNEKEIAVYAVIMKAWLTPMDGDDIDFVCRRDTLALRAFAGTSHAPDLIRLLKPELTRHPSEIIRVSAAHNLAILGDKSSINEVLPFLASKDATIRKMAQKTLKMMGDNLPGPWETSVPE